MKVIELLTKIANGEEVPKKIKYRDIIFDYKKEKGDYESEEGQFFLDWVELNEYGLHDEVEIIEEDKKIEKIDVNHLQQIKKWKRAKVLGNKINEIIDYINGSDKE